MASSPLATCRVVRPGADSRIGQQGLPFFAGISADSVGATGICMHLLTIPPSGRAKAHSHAGHETAIYLISGDVDVWYGEGLGEHLVVHAGEFFYIPPGTPHLPVNLSKSQPCHCLVARTDPNEQESIVLLPELESVVDQAVRAMPATAPTRTDLPALAR